MGCAYTVPIRTGFLYFCTFPGSPFTLVASIPAVPGSYRSPSPIFPTMPWLLSSPQPDPVSLANQSVLSVFFYPLLSLTLPVANWPLIKVYAFHGLVLEVEGSARPLRIHQAPAFNSGTWNCTSCPALKNKTDKKYNVLIEDRIP